MDDSILNSTILSSGGVETATAITPCSSSSDISYPVMALSSTGIFMSIAGMTTNVISFIAVLLACTKSHGLRLGLLNLSMANFLSALIMVSLQCILITSEHSLHNGLHASFLRSHCSYRILHLIFLIVDDVSLYTLAFLSVHLFMVIRWPLKYPGGPSRQRCYVVLAVVWAAGISHVAVVAAMVAAATGTIQGEEAKMTEAEDSFCYHLNMYFASNSDGPCRYSFGQAKSNVALISISVAILGCSLVAIFVSYGGVILVIGKNMMRNRSAGLTLTITLNPRRSQYRVACVMALVTLISLACYLPLFAYGVLLQLNRVPDDPLVSAGLACLLSVATVVDPIICTFRLKSMRSSAVKIVSKCRRTSLDHRRPSDQRNILELRRYSNTLGTGNIARGQRFTDSLSPPTSAKFDVLRA